jgi:hypothetical protein
MGWTPERKETLKSMWQSGRTSREIAEHLGEVTRNAVMGMVNRMGLMGDQGHNTMMKTPTYGACRPKPVVEAKPAVVAEAAAPPEAVAVGPIAAPVVIDVVNVIPETTAVVAAADAVDMVVEEPVRAVVATGEVASPMAETATDDADVVAAAEVRPVVEAHVAQTVVSQVPPDEATDTPPWDAGNAPAPEPEPLAVRHANDEHRAPPARARGRKAETSAVDPRILRGPLVGTRPLPSRPAPVKRESAAIRVPTDGSHPADWRLALTLVEEVTGRPYDPSIPGHKSSLVAIGTVLSRGDPRRVLMPFLSEPQIIASMRILAEKGIVVGGKTPQSWLDPEHGDVSFAIDMLVAEGVLDPKKRDMGMKAAA